MGFFFQELVNGITTGALYALVAVMWLVPDRRIEKVTGRE